MRRKLFNVATALSVTLFISLVWFFLGKQVGPDDIGNSNGLYWAGLVRRRAMVAVAGRVPEMNLDLEAADRSISFETAL